MANADIKALKSMKESFCSISALLAPPSAGKSGAMSLIKSKIRCIDIFNGTKVDDTQKTRILFKLTFKNITITSYYRIFCISTIFMIKYTIDIKCLKIKRPSCFIF